MPSRGKRLTLIIASVAVLVLGVATWQAWPHIQFWWRFESLGPNAQGLPEYRHRATGIVMVRVPGGTFWMGAQMDDPDGQNYDPNAEPDEGPVHEVTLSPFLLGKFEVTQAEWHAVMGDYPSYFDGTTEWNGDPVNPTGSRDRLPVEQVSWDDIQEFEEKTGLMLPTEAQWEFACRAGTETAFSFGSGLSCADWENTPCPERDPYMWYGANSEKRTHEVGLKPANPFGLHDTHGNVLEWCEDVDDGLFYSTPEARKPDPLCASDPHGIPEPPIRVVRGGGWNSLARYCRSAVRHWFASKSGRYDLGFRIGYWPLP